MNKPNVRTPRHWPGAVSERTADTAMMLMLMLARLGQAAGQDRGTATVFGRTLGLVGFGRVGRAVAKRARHGFGMRVLVHNPSPVDPGMAAAYGVEQVTSIDALLPRADFVSLHCSGGEANRHLIDANRLTQMKPDAFLINTAHGQIVDEQALMHALWFETIGGAGLSVASNQLQRLREFQGCDNAIVLPRADDAVMETCEANAFTMIDNVVDFSEGRCSRDLT